MSTSSLRGFILSPRSERLFSSRGDETRKLARFFCSQSHRAFRKPDSSQSKKRFREKLVNDDPMTNAPWSKQTKLAGENCPKIVGEAIIFHADPDSSGTTYSVRSSTRRDVHAAETKKKNSWKWDGSKKIKTMRRKVKRDTDAIKSLLTRPYRAKTHCNSVRSSVLIIFIFFAHVLVCEGR